MDSIDNYNDILEPDEHSLSMLLKELRKEAGPLPHATSRREKGGTSFLFVGGESAWTMEPSKVYVIEPSASHPKGVEGALFEYTRLGEPDYMWDDLYMAMRIITWLRYIRNHKDKFDPEKKDDPE